MLRDYKINYKTKMIKCYTGNMIEMWYIKTRATFLLSFIFIFMSPDDRGKNIFN